MKSVRAAISCKTIAVMPPSALLASLRFPRNLARMTEQLARANHHVTSVAAACSGRCSDFLSSHAFVRHGVLHFPVSYMRGGTSTGVVVWGPHLRAFGQHRDEIIRKIMGVPDEGERKGNAQITGLGRGPSTSNKVFGINIACHTHHHC